mgnify:CR=1 FL=1
MARSPYIEAYRHQVAVGFTDRQYELLVEHCKKCRVSLLCHRVGLRRVPSGKLP